MSSSSKHVLLVGAAAKRIVTVVYDSDAQSLVQTHETPAAENPTWLTPHPYVQVQMSSDASVHRDIVYSNANIDNKVFALRTEAEGRIETLGEASTGSRGSCHMAVAEDLSSLVVAHYHGASVSVIPLRPDGTFATTSPADVLDLPYPSEAELKHPRQQKAFAHQAVVHGQEVLVPDLGSNVVLKLAVTEHHVKVVGSIEGFQPGDGPRHLVVHPSGKYLYTLTEMSSVLVTHNLLTGKVLSRQTIVPPADKGNESVMTAAEIILLPSLKSGGRSLLICTNRDSPNPEGDAIALFAVSADGAHMQRTEQAFVYGAGKHLRGLAASADGKFVVVCGKTSGGMTLYERRGEEGLELLEVAKLPELEEGVAPLWLS